MIPILYGKSETAFTSNGLGRLTDCISCLVTEERNGIFECEFQYPVTGKLYNEMVTNGGIVSVTHDDAKDRQPFDIYKYSAPINGIVTFNARHISYRLSGIVVKPYTAASCALALNGIVTNSVSTNPFTFWTDKAVTTTFKLETPTSAKAILVGQQGSILDVYGKGEYKFDKFEVKLYTNRGTNSGVTIRYGKNLSDTLVENDSGEYYNAIVPYWKGQDGTLVTLTGWYVVQAGETLKYCIPVDFSSEFETQPTELELQTKAAAYLANNTPWLPKENIKVDFVQLWNTDEYKNVSVLERVKLCDTVAIYYPALGLTNSSAKVIKVVYDTLLERYTSIELGEPQQTLAEAIIQPYAEAIASISDKASVSFMEEAIQAATDLIAGGLGGHVVINRNADGEPEEILIMDTDNTSTAVNVWRWNLNGLAHSHSGYNGPFDDIAITQDGKINADMITTGTLNAALADIINLNADNITSGTLSANRISGGTFTVGGVNNQNGIIRILDSSGNEAGSITNTQFYTHRTNGGIVEGASLSSGELRLTTDGTQSVLITRDAQGGGEILLDDSDGASRINLYAENGSLELRYANGDASISASNGIIAIYDENSNNMGLSISPSHIIMMNIDEDLDFRISNGVTPEKKDIELFYVDTYLHKAVELGKTVADAHLRLYSPDNQHNIVLDTLNGSTLQDTTVNGVLDVTQRRCEATLSSYGWYKVCTLNFGSNTTVIGGTGFAVDICATTTFNNNQNDTHFVSLLVAYERYYFVDEKSVSRSVCIDKIRYVNDGNGNGHIDIHYSPSVGNLVAVDFVPHIRPDFQQYFIAESLQSVADSPSGTVLTEYTFSAGTITDISSSFALNDSGISGLTGKIHAIYDASAGLVHLNFSAYTGSSTFGTSTPMFTCSNSKYLPNATTFGNGMVRTSSGEWYPYEVSITAAGGIYQSLTSSATRAYGQITYPV